MTPHTFSLRLAKKFVESDYKPALYGCWMDDMETVTAPNLGTTLQGGDEQDKKHGRAHASRRIVLVHGRMR